MALPTRFSLVWRKLALDGSLGAQGGILEGTPDGLLMLVGGTDNWARFGRCLGATTGRVGSICRESAEPSLEEDTEARPRPRRVRPPRGFRTARGAYET